MSDASTGGWNLRSADRENRYDYSGPSPKIGFRVARDLQPAAQ